MSAGTPTPRDSPYMLFDSQTTKDISFVQGQSVEVLRIASDGKLLWRGREVETDADFRSAMIDLKKAFTGELGAEADSLRAERDEARFELHQRVTELVMAESKLTTLQTLIRDPTFNAADLRTALLGAISEVRRG